MPSESKKRINLLSITLQDLFLLTMGTLPQSKIKSRKSRNIEVRRVLITYMFHFFFSIRLDVAVALCSESSFFKQSPDHIYFFKEKTFLCETEVFCPSSIRLFFFFWLSFSTSVTLYMNISCNLLDKKIAK